MSAIAHVNPAMLRWARLSIGLSIEEAAGRLDRPVATLEAWEAGREGPTYVQLEKAAYKVYRRPIAMFFFPEPPEEEGVDHSFRTLPESELNRIPSRLQFLVRKARVFQMNLSELYAGRNPHSDKLLAAFDFSAFVAPDSMAARVREFLEIDLEEQQRWRSADEALRNWREVLEEHGIAIFKDTFRRPGKLQSPVDEDRFSGFCLYDPEFPLIYVNNNKPLNRQIFTVFHELAHLLMETGGVDLEPANYIDSLSGTNRRIEILCNEFAGEFLVPSSDFSHRTANVVPTETTISEMATFYCVSREVILRRFRDNGRVSRAQYNDFTGRWSAERGAGGRQGGNYYKNRGAYLGRRYIERVFAQYHRNQISPEQAAQYLDVSVRNLPGVEALIFSDGSAS